MANYVITAICGREEERRGGVYGCRNRVPLTPILYSVRSANAGRDRLRCVEARLRGQIRSQMQFGSEREIGTVLHGHAMGNEAN